MFSERRRKLAATGNWRQHRAAMRGIIGISMASAAIIAGRRRS
jgi:hypothetical protein